MKVEISVKGKGYTPLLSPIPAAFSGKSSTCEALVDIKIRYSDILCTKLQQWQNVSAYADNYISRFH